ncbi:MAG: glycine cleavage system protein GcvH [Crenarchaeota archaeon]|nr:glycine cleavage system protein GcvH [Thermoproteota archaeon]
MEEIVVEGYRIPRDRLYTKTDEWAKREANTVIVGVTDYAQKKLRDIVGVDLPEEGQEVRRGEPIASIESVKAAADVYAPVSGRIVEVNERLLDEPELINKDPYGEGWIARIEISDPSELEQLLTPEQYAEEVKKKLEAGH